MYVRREVPLFRRIGDVFFMLAFELLLLWFIVGAVVASQQVGNADPFWRLLVLFAVSIVMFMYPPVALAVIAAMAINMVRWLREQHTARSDNTV
jgi:TRAP-type mannitol/chloroaromatic compound transport system permease small subunit